MSEINQTSTTDPTRQTGTSATARTKPSGAWWRAVRARWDALQRRLGIEPQRAADTALCSECAQARVRVVTMSLTPRLGNLLGWTRWRAYCLLDHVARYSHTDERDEWVWWLPEPATGITWDELVDGLPDEPPGCCGCGGWRGPTRCAVWGPDDGPGEYETYCRPCIDAIRPDQWLPGCTWADLGPHYTIEDSDRLAAAAFPSRQPTPTPDGGGQ